MSVGCPFRPACRLDHRHERCGCDQVTRGSPALRIGLLVLGIVLAVGSLLLSKVGEGGRGAVSGARPRGIVLVCLDTLRADGVSLPGEAEGPMPRLQSM